MLVARRLPGSLSKDFLHHATIKQLICVDPQHVQRDWPQVINLQQANAIGIGKVSG